MTASPEFRYLDRPDQWAALAVAARTRPFVAIDTEYLIEEKHSPVHHSVLHVWSIGWPGSGKPNARGVIPAVAYVLPNEALDHPGLRAYIEDAACEKWAHNAGVDRHAMENRGVVAGGVCDSLSLYRFLLPERVTPGPGFSLDALGRDLLGPSRGKTEPFLSLVARPRLVEKVIRHRTTECSCGKVGCRKRNGHTRAEVITLETVTIERGVEHFPITDIVPGHPVWDRFVAYAARDVLIGSELVQYATNVLLKRKQKELPWKRLTT